MSRTIRLRRAHALNWYGYRDTIPFEGNVLLAGVTGSGKSVLMDLIQFVLVGDQRLVRFNQSATGERSQRTLKGYCLGDTKQEEDGINPYMRQSAITYAALEFIWPDGKRSETWGMRIEFGSAADTQGRISPFLVPCSLERSDFLDTSKRPLDYSAFKELVEVRGGRVYAEGVDAYLRDMAQPVHLNFERSLFRSLLPTAMSFTFLRSFNEFCRQFILPGDKLHVADVTASYRTFLAYERELKELNDQFERLKQIRDVFQSLTDLRRDAVLARYLEATLCYEHVTELLAAEEAELGNVKDSFAGEAKRLKELDDALPELRTQIDRLKTAINATPEGQLYNELTSQNEKLARKLIDLRAIGSTLQHALEQRIRLSRNWLALVHALPLDLNEEIIASCDRALHALEDGGVEKADETLIVLARAARSAAAEASRAAGNQLNRLAEVRRQIDCVKAEIGALKIGKLPFPTRLLDALNSRLPSRGSEAAAHHLRELCEITDEHWRPAIEIIFSRKFAIVVAPEDYDRAEEIYHKLSASDLAGANGRESLINPTKALKLKRTIQHDSLAEKIKCGHPVAAALISHFFGNVIRVESRENLRSHEFAILPDGFMIRGPFVERRRFYDGLPFVGKRGLEQQLAWKQKQAGELLAEERQLQPVEQAVNAIGAAFQETFEVEPSLHKDLDRARELPRLQKELEENSTKISAIDTARFDELATQRRELEVTAGDFEREHRRLLESPQRTRLKNLEDAVRVRREEVDKFKEKLDQVSYETDVSAWLKQLETLRADVLASFPAKDVAARQCGSRFNNADKRAIEELADLKAKRRELALVHPRFEDLPTDVDNIDAHARQLAKLEESEIPDYKQKAERERQNWEDLFRTQVLEKLHTALESVRDLLFFLNNALKQHPIGGSRYQVHYRQNPDFRVYHELVEANALARPGELFFASAEPRFREAIEEFLTLLIEKTDSAEAVRLLDYRQYYEYDMEVVEDDGRKTSVDRHAGKFSGGENQAPYFMAILASYLRAYRRYASRRREPSLGLVPIDEAFSKLSGERIRNCMEAIKAFDLQGVFSMSTGNIPYAFEHCDTLVVVSQKERRIGKRIEIRNVPVSLSRESEEARRIMNSSSRGENAKTLATA
jgi:putative exonuclease SbcCD C subunit/AAA domain-containing protein